MEDKRITAAELKEALSGDLDGLFAELAEAMNAAQPGRIIADSEEPVRTAHSQQFLAHGYSGRSMPVGVCGAVQSRRIP